MSDLYSIQSSTLTDIGDALRRRHGETKTEIIDNGDAPAVISKSPNATGFTTYDGPFDKNLSIIDVVEIPGASKIVVKMSYETKSSVMAYVQVVSGKWASVTPSSTKYYGWKSDRVPYTADLVFENTDAITFFFCTNPLTDATPYLGYYAECVGYDADGNRCREIIEREIPNTYSSAEMAAAIDAIEVGVMPPDSILHLTGDCSNTFKDGKLDWIIEQCGDRMTTTDLTSAENMFNNSQIERIPFSINFKNANNNTTSQTFYGVPLLKELPDFTGRMGNMYNFMAGCMNVREVPESWATTMDFSTFNNSTTWYLCRLTGIFMNCYSLRTIPEAFVKLLWHKCNSVNSGYGQIFQYCHSLDEIVGLRGVNAALTSNFYSDSFMYCYRLKRLVFDMENGSPRTENWQNQTIDLSQNVGYATSGNKVMITDLNSGITADKEVKDDATYQALKNDPDWFSANVAYSRYNHDSAVETINSLPDCSASGGTNTIKFTGEAGSATDGGAINTMTEEEIAVATAKGWTVSFV